jgi:hypothetical protein
VLGRECILEVRSGSGKVTRHIRHGPGDDGRQLDPIEVTTLLCEPQREPDLLLSPSLVGSFEPCTGE